MPRRCKARKICSVPDLERFGPIDTGRQSKDCITMTFDEYETIRLIDLEGKSQEECSMQMEVARTTVQAIYNQARKKLAECLVHGKELVISGGEYKICDGNFSGCLKPCWKLKMQQDAIKHIVSMEVNMRIAVTYEDGMVFQHFGHSENFKLYDIEDKKIIKEEVVGTNGSGHGALAGFLADHKVDVLICGGIGGGARVALSEAGIDLYPGASGSADDCVAALLKGDLEYDPDTMCSHHEGEHNCGDHSHSCGNHGCGNHS